MQEHHSGSTTVELWIRSFAPVTAGPTQERALERIERLDECASVDAVDVGVWGAEVERTDRSRSIPQLEAIEDRLEAFEEWAARADRSLEPFFRFSRVESTITGTSRDVWRLPTLALAEFDDGKLRHVAPCRDGDRTIDVFDRLDALERDEAVDPVVASEGSRRYDEEISDRSTASATNPERRFSTPSSPGPD